MFSALVDHLSLTMTWNVTLRSERWRLLWPGRLLLHSWMSGGVTGYCSAMRSSWLNIQVCSPTIQQDNISKLLRCNLLSDMNSGKCLHEFIFHIRRTQQEILISDVFSSSSASSSCLAPLLHSEIFVVLFVLFSFVRNFINAPDYRSFQELIRSQCRCVEQFLTCKLNWEIWIFHKKSIWVLKNMLKLRRNYFAGREINVLLTEVEI